MERTRYRAVFLLAALTAFIFALAACTFLLSSPESASLAPTSTRTVRPVNTPLPAPPVQVNLPTPAPAAAHSTGILTHSPRQLIEKWKPAITAGILARTACEAALQTAAQQHTRMMGEIEVYGAIMTNSQLLQSAEDTLTAWQPPEDLIPTKRTLQERIDFIQLLITDWLSDQVKAQDIPNLLDETCRTAGLALDTVQEAAAGDGLGEEELSAIATDAQIKIEQAANPVEPREPSARSQPSGFLPEPGSCRSSPFPKGAAIQTPNWEIEVLETLRGEAAWEVIQTANPFNEPAPAGMEYLLVRLMVKSLYPEGETQHLSADDFKVTGDRLIEYSPAPLVPPEPRLNAFLAGQETAEGWAAYSVAEDESNLILVIDELGDDDDTKVRYAALDEGAAIRIQPALDTILPSDSGKHIDRPAPFRTPVITEDWEVSLLEAFRGDGAWALVADANPFNVPPGPDMEYLVVRVRVRNIATLDISLEIDNYRFQTLGEDGTLYDAPLVVGPAPHLQAALFPGGEYEGWIVLQARQGESSLVVFEPLFDFSEQNRRYLSIER